MDKIVYVHIADTIKITINAADIVSANIYVGRTNYLLPKKYSDKQLLKWIEKLRFEVDSNKIDGVITTVHGNYSFRGKKLINTSMKEDTK